MTQGGGMDIIYFWSSIVLVLLPLSVFSWLTWLVIKAYRNRQREPHESR
jgi:hypothetical protein